MPGSPSRITGRRRSVRPCPVERARSVRRHGTSMPHAAATPYPWPAHTGRCPRDLCDPRVSLGLGPTTPLGCAPATARRLRAGPSIERHPGSQRVGARDPEEDQNAPSHPRGARARRAHARPERLRRLDRDQWRARERARELGSRRRSVPGVQCAGVAGRRFAISRSASSPTSERSTTRTTTSTRSRVPSRAPRTSAPLSRSRSSRPRLPTTVRPSSRSSTRSTT